MSWFVALWSALVGPDESILVEYAPDVCGPTNIYKHNTENEGSFLVWKKCATLEEAIKVAQRLSKEYGVPMPVLSEFDRANVRDLASFYHEPVPAGLDQAFQ